MLDGLSKAGFNSIRLPLWPRSEEVKGVVTSLDINPVKELYSRDRCNNISNLILATMKNHTLSKPSEDETSYFDDNYHYFKVYWSPAFDGLQYQESLSEF